MIAWMCIIGPPLAIALMVALALPEIIKQVAVDLLRKPVRDGKTDERWSKERREFLRTEGKRDGTWEPLREWERP